MKHHLLVRALLLGAPVILGWEAHAAPRPSGKFSPTAKTKIRNTDIKTQIDRTPVGERYHLWLSINPGDCNDPQYPGKSNTYDDHRFECYGQLTINGKTYWNVPKEWGNNGFAKIGHLDLPDPMKVNPRQQGYRLNRPWQTSGSKGTPFEFSIYSVDPKASAVRISLKLYDRDNPIFYDDGPYNTPPDRNDDTIGEYKINLDLLKLDGEDGHYYWFWNGKDESGNAIGSNLYLFAEHVGTIYASGKKPNYELPPVVEKPRLPGKIPGPGPITKGRQ